MVSPFMDIMNISSIVGVKILPTGFVGTNSCVNMKVQKVPKNQEGDVMWNVNLFILGTFFF